MNPVNLAEFYAGPCPQAGNGVHRWLYKAAIRMLQAEVPTSEMERHIEAASLYCGRDLQPSEIENAIDSAQRELAGTESCRERTPRWPQPDHDLIQAAVAEKQINLAGLIERSPKALAWPREPMTERVLRELFPPGSLICAGRTRWQARIKTLDEWGQAISKEQFVVPSPMLATIHQTSDGDLKRRCNANTGPRRFLIVESDKVPLTDQPSILLHLARKLPLVLVVFSGGKSLHGWYYAAGCEEPHLIEFFREACVLGADPAMWTRCQWCRMPDGIRVGGPYRDQSIKYFAPDAVRGKEGL